VIHCFVYGEEFIALRQTSELEDRLLSAVRSPPSASRGQGLTYHEAPADCINWIGFTWCSRF